MEQVDATMKKIDEFRARLSHGQQSAAKGKASRAVRPVKSMLRAFDQAMDDDLNTPKALAALFGFQRAVNALIDSKALSRGDYKLILEGLAKVDEVLGIMQFGREPTPAAEGRPGASADSDIQALVDEREGARKMKDYARADAIREKLKERGVVVQDTPDGPVWRVLSTPS